MRFLLIVWFVSSLILHAQTLNINFKQMKIDRLIEITSMTIGQAILTPHPIAGKVNFASSKIHHPEDLVHILTISLQSHGYDLIQEKNFYKIIKLPLEQSLLIELKNANAKMILQSIHKNKQLQQLAEVSLIEDLNALLLVGKKSKIYRLKQMIERLDNKRSQVFVKAKIIEVNNEKVNHVGIEYGLFGSKSTHSELYTFTSSLNGLNQTFSTSVLSDFGISLNSVNSALALGASINLLQQNHAIDIVSEPSILCINNKESSIYVGEKKSIKTASTITDGGTTKESFVREDIGLTLKVTPRISNEQQVVLNIQTILENFSQTSVTNSQPDTSKKEINTTAIVNNAESVIIGGLIENRQEQVHSEVPVLSKLPLLGNLFQDENQINSKKNLMIVITPYIVPKNATLTQLREKLAQLDTLQEEYLQLGLQKLAVQNKRAKKNNVIKKTQSLHEERLKALGY